MRQTLVTAPGGGGVGLTVRRPGGVVTSLPGWPYLDYFKCEDWVIGGAVPSGAVDRPAGELCWWQSGAGGFSGLGVLDVNHPGVRSLQTGAASGQQCELQATAAAGTICADMDFDTIGVIRPNVVDGNTEFRIGLSNDAGINPPTRGAYLEKLFADANIFFVTKEGAGSTRVNTGIVAATVQWLVYRIARMSATEIGWAITNTLTLPALTPATLTLPAGAPNELRPTYRIGNNAAAQKSVHVDYFDLAVFGLGR